MKNAGNRSPGGRALQWAPRGWNPTIRRHYLHADRAYLAACCSNDLSNNHLRMRGPASGAMDDDALPLLKSVSPHLLERGRAVTVGKPKVNGKFILYWLHHAMGASTLST